MYPAQPRPPHQILRCNTLDEAITFVYEQLAASKLTIERSDLRIKPDDWRMVWWVLRHPHPNCTEPVAIITPLTPES